MKPQFLIVSALLIATASAQRVTDRRTADIRGGGGDGKCTIEVLVDDVAEVEVNGRNAQIRTISGAPATIRRFQCNQELPNRPNDFHFEGVDGRGRQELVRAPGNGRVAVVRIEDRQGGSEGYTFDLIWRGIGGGRGFPGGGGFTGGGGGGVRADTAGRGTFNGDRQSERITRGWVETVGQPSVALSGDRDFRITFRVDITRTGRDGSYAFRIIDSDRGRASGTGTFRLNGDRNEVEFINVTGKLNGRNFNGNFNR